MDMLDNTTSIVHGGRSRCQQVTKGIPANLLIGDGNEVLDRRKADRPTTRATRTPDIHLPQSHLASRTPPAGHCVSQNRELGLNSFIHHTLADVVHVVAREAYPTRHSVCQGELVDRHLNKVEIATGNCSIRRIVELSEPIRPDPLAKAKWLDKDQQAREKGDPEVSTVKPALEGGT